jgi:PPOX class probable F420-dependent enzyme
MTAHTTGTVGAMSETLDLSGFTRLAARDHGLCVVATTRADGTVQSSLVNAGVLAHPRSGVDVVGTVVRSDARKLANLRRRPPTTLVAHAGYEWAAVEGTAELIGPDDPVPGVEAEGLRVLLRAVFTAAGGTHDDWPAFDRVMRDERRAAVLVHPTRAYSNA